MMDFFTVAERSSKRDAVEIYPKFIITKSDDMMIRGGDFYAIWIEERGLWSTDEQDALHIIDRELDRYFEENREKYETSGTRVRIMHMRDADSCMIDKWHKYCQKQLRDNFHVLDERLIFSNMPTNKKDYASKRLPYPLVKGDTPSWDALMSVLYSEEEREKIEWAIGAIISGDSVHIQKFVVLYGAAGTGKSTVLNIIQMLFDGYYATFDAKALGSASNAFALEAFKSNPLVAIQHDGDLSRIEDNTRLNSLVSHETMIVNEKFAKLYSTAFKSFLFMGTNKPVKITDAKSGLIRRLIDITPSGNTIKPYSKYKRIMEGVKYELGPIAEHCLEFYKENPNKFDNYIPLAMLGASNDFYNYMLDGYSTFKENDGIALKTAWDMYKAYCDEAKVSFPLSQRAFKEELKNYFKDYTERGALKDGTRVRSYYSGFRTEKFELDISKPKPEQSSDEEIPEWLQLKEQDSPFDIFLKDCPAQYATEFETPELPWDEVETTVKDLYTRKLHYVRCPDNLVTFDFDIPDENGNKCFRLNALAAKNLPPTYAELSKGGEGLHLEYTVPEGFDVDKIAELFDEHVEIKKSTGKRALRRKLSKCNNLDVAMIFSGLPLKEEKKMVDKKQIQSENGLRKMIKRNLAKEIVDSTKSSIDFIFNDLERAYEGGMQYDVSDMYNEVLAFAASSTHQASYCMGLVDKMHFKSDDTEETPAPIEEAGAEKPIAFFDIEMIPPDEAEENPGLFLFCYMEDEDTAPVHKLFNPSASELAYVLDRYLWIGFNNRKYDNHMCYAKAYRNYTNEDLYFLSQRIVNNDKDAMFAGAYNLSYTDVFDFCSEKMSLKKWEIKLGIAHKELGYSWDEPIPIELWGKVGEYCENDVRATRAVFHARQADFTARKILARLAGGTVNDTTNKLTTKFIFGDDKEPWRQFNYRRLGECHDTDVFVDGFDEYTRFTKDGKPVFPGYSFEQRIIFNEATGKQSVVYKSIYRGEEIGEGGYVYAEEGMYGAVATCDSASHHPSTIKAENFFGDKYTARFVDILEARIAVKHGDMEKIKTALGGVLQQFVDEGVSLGDLAYALKIAINSVYGLTSAKFQNPFKHPDNIDNFVAKRGALFMVNLKHEVQKRGFIVTHIKTDSIKIPDATPEIIKFVEDYGKLYGYSFEHESTYDRMCLVNDAVFIAKYATAEWCNDIYGYVPEKNADHGPVWTATGDQFKVPYVFKKLFSKEEIVFSDLCETKSVSTALYLDFNGVKQFVGKVGQFTPVLEGQGGGVLVRKGTDRKGNETYSAAEGSSGYFWIESEMLKDDPDWKNKVNFEYYEKLVNKAAEAIAAHGTLSWFLNPDVVHTLPDYDISTGAPIYEPEIPFN